MPSRIGLLFTGSENWLGGVYYIKNIINALIVSKRIQDHQIFLVVSPWTSSNLYRELPDTINILHYPKRKSIEAKHPLIHKILRKLRIIFGNGYDNFFSEFLVKNEIAVVYPVYSSLTKNFPIKWIGWIPDLQHKFYSKYFSKKQVREREKNYRLLADDADKIVFSSFDSLNTFNDYYNVDKKKLFVLHFRSIIDENMLTLTDTQELEKFNLPKKYFCVSNQWWVHKNHLVVLKSVLQLKKLGIDIKVVFTGNTHDHRAIGYFEKMLDFISENKINDNILILGIIPRYEQLLIMKHALAVIQPSKYEGWSTVVEDAQALGKIIILSDIPVNREQSPVNSFYFNPDDEIELSQKLKELYCYSERKSVQTSIDYDQFVDSFAKDFIKILQVNQ